MYKIIVDNNIVDLLGDIVAYARVYEDGSEMLCGKENANAVVGLFTGAYQINSYKGNIKSTKHKICDLVEIDKDEFNDLYEKLSKNIVIENQEVEEVKEENTEPQPINLLNKITELEAKLNELLNK